MGDGRRQVIERLGVRVVRLPTVRVPETDGTAAWSATTMVLVELVAGNMHGIGYSYVDAAAARLVRDLLEPCVLGADAFAIGAASVRMVHAVRNHGRRGIAACAIAAVDTAMWDLKARLLGVTVADLIGRARDEVPVYASGGFTSTPPRELAREIEGYVAAGHRRVKIKIGRTPEDDVERVRVARQAAGPSVELMVDANGAYDRKLALAMAERFAEYGVGYFEEPVSSDDVAGLRMLRERAPMPIAAGEYGYDAMELAKLVDAVDILQADATRCLGVTGFLQADALCDAYGLPLSAHCAPALHAHTGAAARRLVHIEQFFDHVRMEQLLFDGAPAMHDGTVRPDHDRHGFGLELRVREAERHAA